MMRITVLATIGLIAVPSSALCSGQLPYGSRAGMQVTVVSMSGLDTANAIIRTRHSRGDAIAFCRDYVGKVTEQCVRDELAVRLNDEVVANCPAGTFTDFFGTKYQFKGPNPDRESMARHLLVNIDTGEAADGSMASGYLVNMDIYRALCPRTAPLNEN